MNRKRWFLLVSLLALIALAVLASSLHDVQFEPARPFSVRFSSYPLDIPLPANAIADIPLWKILLFWAGFLGILILFFLMLPPDLRKRLIRQAISFGIGILLLLIALHYKLIQLPAFNFDAQAPPAESQATNLNPDFTAPTFQPPAVAPWMIYLISFGVLLALLVLAWAGYRYWARSRPRQSSRLNDFAAIARSSLDDLASGRDWEDVIIQSYARMSEVVSEKRGLRRAEAMTPREFAERLQFAGLPTDAVGRLTRLFESVRYGARQSEQADINEAVACLNSILQACGAA
ncbi:MAG: DUF4129 domain-containing protein [Chloroflexi bacterium]|nr:DUF4129 domain-containing protein [Chloroflexota bacterium]